jgi:hypothetical protein
MDKNGELENNIYIYMYVSPRERKADGEIWYFIQWVWPERDAVRGLKERLLFD